jgi:hypothetical protein
LIATVEKRIALAIAKSVDCIFASQKRQSKREQYFNTRNNSWTFVRWDLMLYRIFDPTRKRAFPASGVAATPKSRYKLFLHIGIFRWLEALAG